MKQNVRKGWAGKVDEASHLVADLIVEARVPRFTDPPCSVRGRVGVPSAPISDAERYYIAHTLVSHTVLPVLRSELELRVIEMKIVRLSNRRKIEVDERGLSMPTFMWWEKEYVEHPYMRGLPMKDLNWRFHDLVPNALKITKGGKVGLEVAMGEVEWGRYFQHVLTEAAKRDLPYPLFIDKRYAPDWSKDGFSSSVKGQHSSRVFEAVRKWAERSSERHFSVLKYGETHFMERFLEEGEMLISPSPSFDDETLTRAQRDDENRRSVFGARKKDGTAIPASDLPSWWGDRNSIMEYSISTDRDYMLYCMARTLSPTLFSHFGEKYNACVLIHDIHEFARRVDGGTRAQFPRGEFTYAHAWVTYFDPLGAIPPAPEPPQEIKIPIPFLKHFRYAYQQEYRFVWVPKDPRRGFEETCVRIGSLHDIAEIIRV